jgi:ribosomal protein L11 methyltransferase
MSQNQSYFYWAKSSVPTTEFELWSWKFFEAGAASIEELAQDESSITFRLVIKQDNDIHAFIQLFPSISFEITQEEVQDWDVSWKEQQEPIRVSSDLEVLPPWLMEKALAADPNFSGVRLRIEAKQAFGTGHHESTSLMAKLISANYSQGDGATLDVGTGTGILAMYAYKLRPSTLTVTEIDAVCLPCIEENFQLNDLPMPNGVLGFLDTISGSNHYGSILINMIRSEVWPLREDLLRLLAPGGQIYISGQLANESSYVNDWFDSVGIEMEDEMIDGDWWAGLGRLKQVMEK